MVSDVITVKIKINNPELAEDEKIELIASHLRQLANQVENESEGTKILKGEDDDSSIEYHRLINKFFNVSHDNIPEHVKEYKNNEGNIYSSNKESNVTDWF